MKLLVLCALVAVMGVVLSAPQNVQDIQVLKLDSDNDGLGNYNFVFEQSDGQRHNAVGELRNAGAEDAFVAVKGSYSWIGPDGLNYTINYIADENGYQPTIEQPPGGAIPAGVVASLLVKMVKANFHSNINTGEMVLTAIKKLMKNTGWTARTIIKFIRMEFHVSDPKISRKVSRALKRGVRLGLLQLEQGRYRLNMMSSLAKSVTPRQKRQRKMLRALRVRSRTPSQSSRLENFRVCSRF